MYEFIADYLSENFDKIFFSIITLIVLSAALLDIRDKNYPPGPLGLPFFGYLPFLNSKAPYLTLTELSQQYGRVFSVQFGSIYAVIVADAKLMNVAFKQDEFAKRAPLLINHGLMKGNGITGAEGEKWKEHRNFVKRTLKELGKPRGGSQTNILETSTQIHVHNFLKDLRTRLGTGMDITPSLTNHVGLVLSEIVLGQKFEKTHDHFKSIVETMESACQVSSIAGMLNYVPWLKNFSKSTQHVRAYQTGLERNHRVYQTLLEKQLQITGNNNSDVKSVLGAYAIELSKRSDDDVGTFTNEQIQYVMSDLICSGWETSLTTLKWLYIYMALYPDIQENISEEINQVVGRTQPVELKHFEKLPFTEATIMEVFRHRSILPLGIPRATSQKTKIGDHVIPKDAMIVPLLWAMNHDTRVWEKPSIFCPERFLNEDGTLHRSENLCPYQSGNRACIGDDVGNTIVKLFFANTVNQLKMNLPKGYYYHLDETPDCGLTLIPRPYQLSVENRY